MRYVILAEEIAKVISLRVSVYGVLLRKLVSGHRNEVWTLRRVRKLCNHDVLLRPVVSHSPEELVLEDEGELSSCGVHMHLVHHPIRNSGILHHIEGDYHK